MKLSCSHHSLPDSKQARAAWWPASQAPSKPHFPLLALHRVAMILACATESLHGQGDDIANSGAEWQKAGVEQNLQAPESGSTGSRNAACTSCELRATGVQMVASDLRSSESTVCILKQQLAA